MTVTPSRIINTRHHSWDDIMIGISGDAFKSYRTLWEKASSRQIITEYPLYLQFEFHPQCNLECIACIHGIPDIKKHYVNIKGSFDYVNVIKEAKQYNCPSISFHNNNEPLFDKTLESKIAIAKEAGFLDLILTTNATLLDEKRASMIIESGLTKITFSIDANSEETYRKQRAKGSFEKTVSNILQFLEIKKAKQNILPLTRVTFLVTAINYSEIDAFKTYWEDKVDFVEFQNIQVIEGFSEKYVPPGFEKNKNFSCCSPWQQFVIRSNGDVLPCCSFYGSDFIIGNCNESSLHELWHGDAMRKLRDELSHNEFSHPSCQKCSQTFYYKQ